MVPDTASDIRVCPRETTNGLADDLEIAFDGVAQHPVGAVGIQQLVLRHLPNERDGVADVIKEFWRFTLHREASGCVLVPVGNADS